MTKIPRDYYEVKLTLQEITNVQFALNHHYIDTMHSIDEANAKGKPVRLLALYAEKMDLLVKKLDAVLEEDLHHE